MTAVARMMGHAVAGVLAEAGRVRELPLPPFVFGLLAFGVLVLLLGITWSFRNVSHRR